METADPKARPAFYQSLYLQVLVAIVLGIALGVAYPDTAVSLRPLGDGFIKLVKMLITPVIFCTVVLGIAGMEQLKHAGKAGGLALLYFELVSTLALIIGLIVVNVVKPGAGMNIDVATLDAASIAKVTEAPAMQGVSDFLLNVIPVSVVDAFAKNEILQVLLFALLFGVALHAVGGRNSSVFQFFDGLSQLLFKIIGYVMKLAPLGALGAMAFTIGRYGLGTLLSLGQLMVCFYATCLLFILLVLGLIARAHGFRILRLIRYLRDELLIVLGTSSSESVLPRMMARMEDLGVRKSVVGLVIPAGYSFNLDGTSIYLTMAAVFIAQATNTPLDIGQQLTLLAVLLLTSKGAAGVTGSGLIVLAATLSAVGQVPMAGVALILGIDRFMSEARALTNLIGNAVATIVVGKWCKAVDESRLSQRLSAS